MKVIYAIMLKDWDMPNPEPQEYFTSMRKANNRLNELERVLDTERYNVERVSPYKVQGVRKSGNQYPRQFFIQSIDVK